MLAVLIKNLTQGISDLNLSSPLSLDRKVIGSVELELEMVVSYQIGDGSQTHVLGNNNS